MSERNLGEELLLLAEKAIATEGLNQLSLRALARELGVSHNAPSRHFADKSALVNALARRALEGVRTMFAQIAQANPDDPVARLNLLAKGYMTYVEEHPGHFLLLSHPELFSYTDQLFDQALADYMLFFNKFVIEAQQAGWMTGKSMEVAAGTIISLTLGLASLRNNQSTVNPATLQRELIEAIVDATVPPSRHSMRQAG